MDWRGLILVAVFGICIGLVSGLVENYPEASVIGHKYYGYPLVCARAKYTQTADYSTKTASSGHDLPINIFIRSFDSFCNN